MSGTDILDTEAPETPEPPGHQQGERFRLLRRLSERTPLRTKLITAVLLLVIVALTVISFTSTYVLRSYLTTAHDPELVSTYQQTAVEIQQGGIFKYTDTLGQLSGDVYIGLQPYGEQISPAMPAGGNFLNNGNPPSQSVPNVPSTQAWAKANTGKHLTLGSVSGPDTWRVIVSPVTTSTDQTGTLIVAYDLGDINAVVVQLVRVDVIVSVAIIIVLTVVAVGIVRSNLRPLDDIELTAGQIAAGHLNHRVPEGDPRTEIGSLGRSLNIMLTQIERAFHAQGEAEQAAHQSEERMRRFIADAAHELRTPLTTIRGFAAHYRQRGGTGDWSARMPADGSGLSSGTGAGYSPAVGSASSGAGAESGAMSGEELDRLMSRVESEATRMGLLVEDLLTLARLDQQRPLSKGPVDLLSLAADAVQDARIVSAGRAISLSVAPGTAFIVDGDEARLRQVLANLVNNAITHTPAGTAVRVKIARGVLEASAARGTYEPVPAVVLDVEDDGPGMAPEQAQRVFERFYRADAARNRASGGTGLGLAIVAGLVSAHGGTVAVRTAPGRGADFQVKLPLSPDVLGVDDGDDGDDD